MTSVAKLAADADPVAGTWTWGGETFTLRGKLDLRVTIALKRGEFDRAFTYALGAEQVDRLMEIESDEPLDEDALVGLMEAWAAVSGTSLGESSASSRSSKSTVRPSKRTSSGTTKRR